MSDVGLFLLRRSTVQRLSYVVAQHVAARHFVNWMSLQAISQAVKVCTTISDYSTARIQADSISNAALSSLRISEGVASA